MKARIITLRRRSATLAAGLLLAGALAGNAAGAVPSVWEEAWAQIKPLLQQPGTINQTDNPVHWTKLKGVPTAFADGTDSGVDKAGFGLKKNLYPNLEFAVDTSKIQERINVYQGSRNSGGAHIGDNWSTLAGALELPAGSWAITAVAQVGANELDYVSCRLDVESDGVSTVRDEIVTNVYGTLAHVPVVLMGTATSPKPLRTAVVCRDSPTYTHDGESHAFWFRVKIIAVPAGEVHTQTLVQ